MSEIPRFEGSQFESLPEKKEGDVEFLPLPLCETCKENGINCLFQDWTKEKGSPVSRNEKMYFLEELKCPNIPQS